ncbi:MAG: hypothetical protein WC100_02490 [Sterolibacterium sp.]
MNHPTGTIKVGDDDWQLGPVCYRVLRQEYGLAPVRVKRAAAVRIDQRELFDGECYFDARGEIDRREIDVLHT